MVTMLSLIMKTSGDNVPYNQCSLGPINQFNYVNKTYGLESIVIKPAGRLALFFIFVVVVVIVRSDWNSGRSDVCYCMLEVLLPHWCVSRPSFCSQILVSLTFMLKVLHRHRRCTVVAHRVRYHCTFTTTNKVVVTTSNSIVRCLMYCPFGIFEVTVTTDNTTMTSDFLSLWAL